MLGADGGRKEGGRRKLLAEPPDPWKEEGSVAPCFGPLLAAARQMRPCTRPLGSFLATPNSTSASASASSPGTGCHRRARATGSSLRACTQQQGVLHTFERTRNFERRCQGANFIFHPFFIHFSSIFHLFLTMAAGVCVCVCARAFACLLRVVLSLMVCLVAESATLPPIRPSSPRHSTASMALPQDPRRRSVRP